MKFEIKHRYTNVVLFSAEAGSLKLAVELAVESKAYLDGAYLRGAYLDGAYLRGAYLDGAYLRGANLRGANLGGAFLEGANLGGASLAGANLAGAFLEGANLRGANLRGAKSVWQSHNVIAEILRRAASDDIEKRKLAGLILISRDWCWKDFLRHDDPLKPWAVSVMREFGKDDDSLPEELKLEAANPERRNA